MKRIVPPVIIAFTLAICLFSVTFAQSTPTRTPTRAPTEAPTGASAVVLRDANLRAGPGTTFEIVGSAKAGDTLFVVSKNTAGDWYELEDGKWIAAFLVRLDAAGPETPTTATPSVRITATVTPAPTATPQILGSLPYTFTGVGDSIVDVSAYSDRLLALVVGGNSASRHFAVIPYDEDGDRLGSLVNTTDVYAGLLPLNLRGTAAFLEIKAVGEWKIVAYPLAVAPRIVKGEPYTGKGDFVLIVDDSSVRTATIIGNQADRHFAVHGYDKSGSPRLLVNTTEPYVGTVLLRRDTILLVFQAVGEWIVTLE